MLETCLGLDVPPKLKHFLWRACKGTLAVKENLFNQHITHTKICSICDHHCESIFHTLFQCKFAQIIWSRSNLSSTIADAPNETMIALLLWLADELNGDEFRLAISLMWAAWHCRNKCLFEGEQPIADVVARGFVGLVEDYISYNQCTNGGATLLRSVQSSAARWSLPHNGCVKVNTDAHVSSVGFVGLGAIIRDHHGKVLCAAVARIEGCWEASVAEARAALLGVQLARRLDFQNIILECDSLLTVRGVNSCSMGRSTSFLFIDEIIKLKSCFNVFYCSHVKRDGNCVAHLVARGETEIGPEHVWLDPIPQFICNVADFDLI